MKKLFIAMPYGVRKSALDYEQPDATVQIDFDAVWEGVLQPAIPLDFETKRADELRQPGLIDRLYNEWLFDADIVLADLTFGNPNVYYELGIRQALSKKGTVLVACKGTKLPFDVRNQYVINYDYFAAPTLRAFQTHLRQAIENASGQEIDSPVHVFLPGLVVRRSLGEDPPERTIRELTDKVRKLETDLGQRDSRDDEDRFLRKLQEADSSSRVLGLYRLLPQHADVSVGLLERMAVRLRQFGCFDEALAILQRALERRPSDPELLREAGFAYRKKGPEFYLEAEKYLRNALELNDSDVEVHGMLGGLLKRREEYGEAFAQYRRAHQLEPTNLYALVTLGGICAALRNAGEARNWYRELQAQCDLLVARGAADYWTFLCLGEAAVAFGDEEGAVSAYRRALALNLPIEDLRSACEQLEFLVKSDFAIETARRVLPVLYEGLSAQAKA